MSLLAAQTDFKEAGELTLFIDEAEVSYLEDIMWEQGYLDSKQMAGAFHLLRSNDLIWSRMLHEYFLGEPQPMNDMMAWNADATRMPYRMHSQYLRRLFLNNDLAEGRYEVDERKIALTDIRTPIFAVGTETDHVAPWRSVFKIHLLTDTDVTFLLTNGGHNAGIVSEPGHAHRHFRMSRQNNHHRYVDPDTWFDTADVTEGSWWPAWQAWLAKRSGKKVAPPAMGAADKGYRLLADAPGEYVLQP
jgi:polyhydroxyalkanoate synthase